MITRASTKRPEILAPAGDEECLHAAMRAGADAVYFGVQGFNARARAANFALTDLPRIMDELHTWGAKGFVTLNTLVFEEELADLERVVRGCADAGVDAVIVQDLGVVALVKAVAPQLAIHASTQMTCTDAASVQFAADAGASRVVLARELTLSEIRAIQQSVTVELEVFVHGALCVSYSGQCLTSEAIGGRSANRGACAQACRLPYDFVVDGAVQDLGDRAYLLSPQDLEASALVNELADIGVSCLKIEGRLKGPAYVAAATRLYRAAVDGHADVAARKQDALVTYSRGSGPGFLAGVDHQQLVEAETCDHRGVLVGTVRAVERDGKRTVVVLASGPDAAASRPDSALLKNGDGVVVQGARAGAGEVGGRVWDVVTARGEARVWLGPDVVVSERVVGHRVFKNDDPALEKQIVAETQRAPHKDALAIIVRGKVGSALTLEATSERGRSARVTSAVTLEEARTRALDDTVLRDKLGRLGDTPFSLSTLTIELVGACAIAPSALNDLRRQLVDALLEGARHSAATAPTAISASHAVLLEQASRELAAHEPAAPGLFVLCRNLEQAVAAHEAGADGIWLDFLALTGTQRALHELKERGAKFVGAAPPRIRKPGDEKIAQFLAGLPLDGDLVRSLGALVRSDGASGGGNAAKRLRVGDFSLNVTNRLSARAVLAHVDAFVPSFDLNAGQLARMLAHPELARAAELVVHHPMPLFHMEHCVFAALLSNGADYRTCGRPCETHVVALRDRVGMDHPVEADVGCRNTVFHARAQSAASSVAAAQQAGVARFRIELVRESAQDTARLVTAYRKLLAGGATSKELFAQLKADDGYGVVKGSLRVLA